MKTKTRTSHQFDPIQSSRFHPTASLVLLGALAAPVAGATINVPSQFPTIQAAIDASANGDVIKLRGGTYFPNTTIDTKGKAITITGATYPNGGPASMIDGQGLITVLTCINGEDAQTRFENLVIMNGNSSQDGGGMYNVASSPFLTNCTFKNNTATNQGGGICNNASHTTLRGCLFEGNSASHGGGLANHNNSDPALSDCIFSNNSAAWGGGGMYNTLCHGSMTRCSFQKNVAPLGGALHTFSSNPAMILECTFRKNQAENGGGIFVQGATLIVRHCVFSTNIAQSYGGAVEIWGWQHSPSFNGCTFKGNSAGVAGGGISAQSGVDSTVRRCEFTGNFAPLAGGLYCYQSYVTVQESRFSQNTADNGAGATCFLSSGLTFTKCSFSGNVATLNGGAAYGGYFVDCRFTSNMASGDGGGIYSDGTSQTTTRQCMFSQNSGTRGGAMFCAQGNTNHIEGCWVTFNTATTSGGGIHFGGYTSQATLQSTYFCNNTPDHIDGFPQDQGGNTFCP